MSALKRIREIKLFLPVLKIRDRLMYKTGLFTLKKQVKHRLFLKRLVREDNKLKKEVAKKIMALPVDFMGLTMPASKFVLSLTSYGKRVEESLPYTLYSLLTQTILPYKIAVFLDESSWSNENLPDLLKQCQLAGVEFHYCEDIRSYKKLIPALSLFQDNPIITVDDDFYYNPHFIEWMNEAYLESDKQTVLGQCGCIPEKKDGKYLPYNLWKDCQYGDDHSPISFIGCGGICYPPHIFDKEIEKEDVFMRLCPKADDIWFWVMEERLGIKRAYINPKGYGYHRPIDRIYDYQVGADGCLTLSNVINGENDQQLRNVLDYYSLD